MVKKETNVSRHSSIAKSLLHTQRFRVRLEARWIDAKVVLNLKKYICCLQLPDLSGATPINYTYATD